MTAGAMIVGLIPMSLGLSDGSEQNAALGRAGIGGLLLDTCATLLVAPYLYTFFCWLRRVRMTAQETEVTA
jgi:multidrug efflux pump subunit AcrB